MSKLKELMSKFGVTFALVGGSLVVGSVFGKWVLSPSSVTTEEPATADEAPPAEPDGAAAPEESDD